MRLKKDDVRNKILQAAKTEFFTYGYQDANMRSIAQKAEITPGNIYRYYPSKEDLLEAIVNGINEGISNITKLESVIHPDILSNSKKMTDFFINKALDIVEKNKYEAIILLSKSQGSKYENAGKTFIEFTAQSIQRTTKDIDYDVALMLAKTVVYTEISILEENINDIEKFKYLSIAFLNAIFAKFGVEIKQK